MADTPLPHRFAEVPAPDLTARRAAQLDEGSAATFDKADHDKASRYQADASLTAAVNAAIVLSKPLLLMGPPGTGKTELARALAWQLDIPLYKFETKSSSQSRDLFYTYDSLRAFSDRESQIDHRKYLSFQALGRAILDAVSGDDPQRKALEGDAASGTVPRRSVVLIDEIDKAPRDFPNDLLNEIEHLYFKVPELHRNAQSPGGKDIAPAMRPIVIITSNDERGLPAPFLRRCLFHHIAFPAPDRMRAIVRAHLKLGRCAAAAGARCARHDLLRRPSGARSAGQPALHVRNSRLDRVSGQQRARSRQAAWRAAPDLRGQCRNPRKIAGGSRKGGRAA